MPMDRLVGEAYILMRGDGTLLKRDFQKAGHAGGAAYTKAFDEELGAAEARTFDRFRQSLATATAEVDFSKFRKEFGSVQDTVKGVNRELVNMRRANVLTVRQVNRVKKELLEWADAETKAELSTKRLTVQTKRFGDVLESLNRIDVDTFTKDIAEATRSGDFTKLRNDGESVSDMVDRLNRALVDLAPAMQTTRRDTREISQSLADWADGARDAETQQERLNQTLVDFRTIYSRGVEGMWKRYATELATAVRTGDFKKMRNDGESVSVMLQRMTRELKANSAQLGLTSKDIDDITTRMRKWATDKNLDLTVGGKDGVARTHALTQALDAVSDRTDSLNIVMGRAFGKGSRNNFLNFVGTVVSGMGQLVTSVPLKIADTIASVGSAFADGFSAARAAGLTRFAAAGRGIASVFAGKGGIVGAIVAAGVAAVGFGKVLPAIAGGISMLAASAVSLVGSVGIGLVGALLAMGPAAVAAAAGVGILAGAWASWRDSAEAEPILEKQKKEFDAFFKTLYPAIRRFNDLMADAFLGLGDRVRPGILSLSTQLEAIFDAPGTQGRLDAWGDSIERMFGDISNTIADFTEGLIAFFVPILPYAERLTGAISDMAERFRVWTTSAQGQNSIATWMDKAWAAASALWDLLREVGEAIGLIFTAGADQTGTGWIQGMADGLADFNDYLRSPEGKAALEGWFADAKQFGEDIGNVIGDLVGIFRELDSPEGRKNATEMLDAIKGIAGFAVDIAALADDVGRLIDNLIGFAPPKFLADLLSGNAPDIDIGGIDSAAMQTQFDELKTTVSTFVSETWASISQWASDTGSTISTWASGTWSTISTFFADLPGNISTWVGETMVSMEEGFRNGGIAVMEWLTQFLNDLAIAITEFDLSEFAASLGASVAAGLAAAGTAISTWFSETSASIGAWVAQTWASFTTWASGVVERIGSGLAAAPGRIAAWAAQTLASFNAWVASTLARMGEWAARLPQMVSDAISRMGAFLSALPGRIAGWLSSVPARLSQPFRTAWDQVNSYFDGAPGRLAAAVGRVISSIAGRLSGVYNTIVGPFQRAWDAVQALLGRISSIRIPNPAAGIDFTPWNAAGNIYNGATVVGVGEAGPEAIVPLNRPLNMVNPNVRALSAIAQGIAPTPWMAQGGVVGGGSNITIEEGALQVVTAATSPDVVGSIVFDGIADAIYAAVAG